MKIIVINYLTRIVDQQIAARDSVLSILHTTLNADVSVSIEKDDYIVEKILFERRPNFFVSANLHLPKENPVFRASLLNVIHQSILEEIDTHQVYQALAPCLSQLFILFWVIKRLHQRQIFTVLSIR